MTIANNIRYLRKKHNYSQDKLAELLEYKSFTTIQKWESGVSEPPLKICVRLAELFNVDVDDLVGSDLTDGSISIDYRINPEAALLVQEVSESPKLKTLVSAAKELNEKGQDKLIEHAQLLAASKRYVKESYFNPSSYTVNPSHMSMVAEDTVEHRCGDCDDSATNK